MKVISRKQMPAKIPLMQALVVLLALEHWNAPGWMYGACGVIYAAATIGAIYRVVKDKEFTIDFDAKKGGQEE